MRCDCHVHVVGPVARYPQVASRTYLAGIAPLADLRRHAAACGISRFVIVQPSFYASDNSLLLESLDTLGAEGRGVAVLDQAAATSPTLREWAARGVRGLRLNHYSPAALTEVGQFSRRLAAMADCVRALDWHLEVIAPIGLLAEHADALAHAAVPIVIDHYGLHGRTALDSTEARRLLELMRLPHVWIKLSAPYRVSDDPLDTQPDPAWLAAILAVARDRCVWGSDWPHTPPHSAQRGRDLVLENRDISYAALVDDFLSALASAQLVDAVMRDNPARLYGFPS